MMCGSWLGKAGAQARLTSSGNVDEGPYFSPDGRTIAYSARVDGGSPDVYTVPASGGIPKRITFHPAGNYITGWSPDGKDLLLSSMQDAVRTYFQIFRVHADGTGLPQRIPVPSAYSASLSPDQSHMAYTPFLQWQGES